MSNMFAWQRSYRDAMLELDPAEMPAKLKLAATELRERSKELIFSRDAASLLEWQAIADALSALRAVERSELTPTPESRQWRDAGQRGAL